MYLICKVDTIKEKDQISELIEQSSMVRRNLLDFNKMVFCLTWEGKAHIVRHIEPHIHIDTDVDVINKLRVSIPKMVLVNDQVESDSDKIEVCTYLPDSNLVKNLSNL